MTGPRPVSTDAFKTPNRDYGILPFWFLNGELEPDEMLYQLKELRDKGMQGVVFHGRYGLEMPYLGPKYLDRIRLGVEEANRLGLDSWIYDEMNWPSGTADKAVLRERPDLAQRYLECVSFTVRGPWFMCLTGEDSRYLDFQRSTPVAVFAIAEDGAIHDLTSNLSFQKVVPWEVPPGEWRLCYVMEKRADYYIDALDPEATETFLRLGYKPYLDVLQNGHRDDKDRSVVGFYSDEPAMHYFLTAGNNPIVPWTKDMFRRFQERNSYDLRSRLLDLFFDLRPEAARTRHDFYNTTTEFYSNAYYKQLHDWCRERDLTFTAHLLYEEWIRQMVRVEGNPFRHYEHMDVVAVDHLYPVIGTRESPADHVAIKLASSAAHHFGSDRLICESFGGIFMDATMQRMKWIADWEYVLGVTVLNPHGFHYTFEGARKRDWPPSMFYQYPWWPYYEEFSAYTSRASELLTGGRHVAKVAVLWPINAMFASYLPQDHTAESSVIEGGLNVLTDLLLRLHHDFDYLDEDVLAGAEIADGKLRVADEDYELLLVPPMAHIRETSLDAMERFVAGGGRVLGTLMSPRWGLTESAGAQTDHGGLAEVSERVKALLGAPEGPHLAYDVAGRDHGRGRGAFLSGDPAMLAMGPGPQRDSFADALDGAIRSLIEPDIEISNPEIFVVHRRRDESDMYFLVNTTFEPQAARVRIPGEVQPALWDPTSGRSLPTSAGVEDGWTAIEVELPPVGSTFVVTGAAAGEGMVDPQPSVEGRAEVVEMGEPWTFSSDDPNGLVIKGWRAMAEEQGDDPGAYAASEVDDERWHDVVAGAWAYQLPAEPTDPWPIPVWYRTSFDVDDVPDSLSLLMDGFDGEDASVWLNGEAAPGEPVRSRIDSQMRELDLTGSVRAGRNVLAIRMVLPGPTSGLVDHVKLLGSFALAGDGDAGYRMVAREAEATAGSWTSQGYPFLSGRGEYRTTFDRPASKGTIVLEVPMVDDVLEVEVNGERAGVRLWDPYVVDISPFVREGSNDLTLRVANTPANLLNGDARHSGIAGAPRLVIHEASGVQETRASGVAT